MALPAVVFVAEPDGEPLGVGAPAALSSSSSSSSSSDSEADAPQLPVAEVPPAAPQLPDWRTPEDADLQQQVWLVTFAAVLDDTAGHVDVPLRTLQDVTREEIRDAVAFLSGLKPKVAKPKADKTKTDKAKK